MLYSKENPFYVQISTLCKVFSQLDVHRALIVFTPYFESLISLFLKNCFFNVVISFPKLCPTCPRVLIRSSVSFMIFILKHHIDRAKIKSGLKNQRAPSRSQRAMIRLPASSLFSGSCSYLSCSFLYIILLCPLILSHFLGLRSVLQAAGSQLLLLCCLPPRG